VFTARSGNDRSRTYVGDHLASTWRWIRAWCALGTQSAAGRQSETGVAGGSGNHLRKSPTAHITKSAVAVGLGQSGDRRAIHVC